MNEISQAAAKWLVVGERGVSSNTIMSVLSGLLIQTMYHNHPHDPDDFKRCEKLLREVPELREQLPLMADVSLVWARLVERWDEIVTSLEKEIPGIFDGHYGSAPITYQLMRKIIDGKQAK